MQYHSQRQEAKNMLRKLKRRASMFLMLSGYIIVLVLVCDKVPSHDTLRTFSYRARSEQECYLQQLQSRIEETAQEKPWMQWQMECQPVNSVAFLKIHKCASSSIQNILMRYGEKKGFLFALPKEKNFFPLTTPFNASFVVSDEPYHTKYRLNIYAMHAVWNLEEIKKIMLPGFASFTMIREPSETFLSLYDYFAFERVYNLSVDEFIMRKAINMERLMGCLSYNVMACDMGARPGDYTDKKAIKLLAYRMELEFDLVMIAERFEESLVLLAHLLCWPYDDLVSYSVNTRISTKKNLKPSVDSMLKKRLAPDYYIYEYFVERFDVIVKTFGEARMAEELKKLRAVTDEKITKCGIHKIEPNKTEDEQHVPGVTNVAVLVSNSSDRWCRGIVRPEHQFVYRVKQSQKEILDVMKDSETNHYMDL